MSLDKNASRALGPAGGRDIVQPAFLGIAAAIVILAIIEAFK